MLLPDRRIARLPSVAQFVQQGDQHLRDRDLDRHGGEQAVQRVVRTLCIEAVERGADLDAELIGRGAAGPDRFVDARACRGL
jgi:hypothetical protein